MPADPATWLCETFNDPDGLPVDARALFDPPGGADVFATEAWYRCLVDTAKPQGARPLFVLCRVGTRAIALFPLQRLACGTVESLTGPYTCLYRPLLAQGCDDGLLQAAGRAFGRFCRGLPPLRLDALDADWPALAPLIKGMRAAGLAVLRFDHFGNWHEDVADLGWDAYLRSREGALRETVRRKLARAKRDPMIAFERIDRAGEGLEAGIAAFEEVYARSWKDAEPYPRFNAAFMRMAAGQGVLRLGVLRHEGRPVAVQYWTVAGGIATVLKLAHDEASRALSPGTVLTALMLGGLLDDERVQGLDFGRGDDPYKRQWTSHRRQRIGLILADPRRVAGLRLILMHFAGRIRHLARRPRPSQGAST